MKISGNNVESLADFILAEYNRSKGLDKKKFSEVYDLYFADKFDEKHGGNYSSALKNTIRTSYKKCSPLYNIPFVELNRQKLQDFMDSLTIGYASQENIKYLLNQMYKFAILRDICDKNYAAGLKIIVEDGEEHGVPFTDQDLAILWQHKEDYIAEFLLIMCYCGYRISAFQTLEINLEERYFKGGIKTKSSKNRIVPIHSAIYDMVKSRKEKLGFLLDIRAQDFRKEMYTYLESLGIEKHTPHDCRHTFSSLCEKYGVRENDRKRMMGHKIGDITNDVYGHRNLEELREEIEKIKIPLFCD